MTTPSDDSDSMDSNSESPQSDFEAGFQRILAYLSEKRYRRWIAYVMVFVVIYSSFVTLFGYIGSFLIPPLLSPDASFPSLAALKLWAYAMRIIPLPITLLIFLKLRTVYRNFDQSTDQ